MQFQMMKYSYLHSMCSPPIAHSNLKAGNILLDEELRPHLSDCGLAVLRPLRSNTVKLKFKTKGAAITCELGFITAS